SLPPCRKNPSIFPTSRHRFHPTSVMAPPASPTPAPPPLPPVAPDRPTRSAPQDRPDQAHPSPPPGNPSTAAEKCHVRLPRTARNTFVGYTSDDPPAWSRDDRLPQIRQTTVQS